MKFYILAAVIFLFTSCFHEKKREIGKDTKDILNLAVEKIVGSDTLWRNHFKVPPPIFPPEQYDTSSNDFKMFIKWKDSLKAILDSAELFIVINHLTDSLSTSEIEQIKNTLNSKENAEYEIGGDTSFNSIVNQLYKTNFHADSIPIDIFNTNYKYNFYSDLYFPHDKIRKIGSITFSKIEFNKAQSKAIIYTRFNCGSLCGFGQILFFEKNNGKWEYSKTWELWVS